MLFSVRRRDLCGSVAKTSVERIAKHRGAGRQGLLTEQRSPAAVLDQDGLHLGIVFEFHVFKSDLVPRLIVVMMFLVHARAG